MSTDGENKNVGQHHGLWRLIDNERQKMKLHHTPVLKSVCAVHSSALAYKGLCKHIPEISNLVSTLSGLASFFHTSACRTAQLRNAAEERSLTVQRFPKFFEVRWCEFTSSLIDSVLCSWRALIAYFTTAKQNCKSSTSDATRFQKTLTSLDNVKLMCFLADLLFLLKNFQKRLQSDEICITDLKPQLDVFTQKLLRMETSLLVGGWEETLGKELKLADGDTLMFDTLLWIKQRRRESSHEYVTDKRDFVAIRHDSIRTIFNFDYHLTKTWIGQLTACRHFSRLQQLKMTFEEYVKPCLLTLISLCWLMRTKTYNFCTRQPSPQRNYAISCQPCATKAKTLARTIVRSLHWQ